MLTSGQRLDRYELLCAAGAGGMASVWAARLRGKHGFENLVAIKTILPQHADDPAFEKMALDEARIVAAVRHPNVASIVDVGEKEGLLYLVFEWVDGEQLSVLRRAVQARGKKFPVGIALRIVADVCSGLHAAHELTDDEGWPQCVVHRDVSPQNILVSATGGVKVIDFGVAKASGRLVGRTSTGIIKGKILFMAPEQARGEDVDRRVDVWAAGVVLYQLLAERLPIEGENQIATIRMLADGVRPAPLPDHVPAAVADVIHQALQTDPAKRFQTAAEMHRAIEAALALLCGPVTSADVAAFVSEHARSGLVARRKFIQSAIRKLAAIEREPSTQIVVEDLVRAQTATLPSAGLPPRPRPRSEGRPRTTAAVVMAAGIVAGLVAWKVSPFGSASASMPAVSSSTAVSAQLQEGINASLEVARRSADVLPAQAAEGVVLQLPPVCATPASSTQPRTPSPLAPARRKDPRHVFSDRF